MCQQILLCVFLLLFFFFFLFLNLLYHTHYFVASRQSIPPTCQHMGRRQPVTTCVSLEQQACRSPPGCQGRLAGPSRARSSSLQRTRRHAPLPNISTHSSGHCLRAARRFLWHLGTGGGSQEAALIPQNRSARGTHQL